MLTVFDSATFAACDRLEAFRRVVSASLDPTTIESPDQDAFTARLRAAPLGDVLITSLAYTSLTARRSPREIRRSDPENYQFCMARSGEQSLAQGGAEVLLGPSDIAIRDSSQPYEAVVSSAAVPAEAVVMQMPKRLLPLPAQHVTGLCANALPGDDGIGRVLAAFLLSLAEGRTRWTERDALRLETIAVDLTTAMLAHHLERDNPPLRSPTETLYLQVIAFIDRNLQRPELRPATIAAAHRISTRYLHRIFQQHHPVSVAAHIRALRLDRARRDLADRRLDHLTIAAIARRWGFHRPADFSRAFQRHTGIPPSDYRSGR